MVAELLDKLGQEFAEQTEYLSRYGDSVKRSRKESGFNLDISAVGRFRTDDPDARSAVKKPI
jgi:hypothetical protein